MTKLKQLLQQYCPEGVDFQELAEVAQILN